jgi:hypothetical protein
VRIRNPRGSEEFEVFPNLPFFWTNNPLVLATNPPGSKYFGNVVRQPPQSARILQTIAFSFRLDPRWFDRYARAVEMLMRNQVQHIRADVHYVVTEYGVAHLFGKNLHERAEALIGIAAPQFQSRLEAQARERKMLT